MSGVSLIGATNAIKYLVTYHRIRDGNKRDRRSKPPWHIPVYVHSWVSKVTQLWHVPYAPVACIDNHRPHAPKDAISDALASTLYCLSTTPHLWDVLQSSISVLWTNVIAWHDPDAQCYFTKDPKDIYSTFSCLSTSAFFHIIWYDMIWYDMIW